MRWLFVDRNLADEMARYQATLDNIDHWWKLFQTRMDDIDALFSGTTEWDLAQWMIDALQEIDPRLMWEFGPALRGTGHRLVITPESERQLRPLTATLIERAPKFDGWEFYTYRLPEDIESAGISVRARTEKSLEGVFVRPRLGEHHLVDLSYSGPAFAAEDDEEMLGAVLVATESLLGEECLDKWIGVLEIEPVLEEQTAVSSSGRGRAIPLGRLRESVEALVGSVIDQLPDQPHAAWVDEGQWTTFQLKPTKADDYPTRTDLLVAVSGNQDLWMAAHANTLFFSERFSRVGEVFCYVKIDGSGESEEMLFGGRDEIEDTLDEALKSDGVGGVIGGGTGLRYSYVDLAITDIHAGVDVVRRVLAGGNVPKRSWILFFDDDLVDEWVGVHDDSPPPP